MMSGGYGGEQIDVVEIIFNVGLLYGYGGLVRINGKAVSEPTPSIADFFRPT